MENNSPKQLRIKPLGEQWTMFVITAILGMVLVIGIGIIVSVVRSDEIPWKWIGIVFAIYSAFVVIIAIISRILYRGKLIVTENEIVKTHGKKVQFKIDREKLLYIGIRRTNICVKLIILVGPWIGDLCTDLVSFRFKEAEIFEMRRFGNTLKMSSLTDEDEQEGIKEFVECLSYRQAKKISNILNVPIQKVIF